MSNTEWKRGQKARIAKIAKIGRPRFSDIINRRRHAKPPLARRLAAASAVVLGPENKIPWTEFLESESSVNRYFIGKPTKKRD